MWFNTKYMAIGLSSASISLILNTTILSVATFSNIEVVLKIVLLVISIVYTADKWYFQKKKRDGKK